MPSLISNKDTGACLRGILITEGYSLNPPKANDRTGVDILTKRSGETIYIEVIGFKEQGPSRAKDFFEVFFRALSRIGGGAERTAIALPGRFEVGLPARAGQYGTGWNRIGTALPELEIWLVDLETKKYRQTKWNDWSQ